MKYTSMMYEILFYILTKYIMPNRDGTWPQGKGPMTGAKMWNCKDVSYQEGKNIPFERGQGKRCGEGLRKWMGNRWTSVAEPGEDVIKEGE